MTINLKRLLSFVGITLGTGIISGLLTMGSMEEYKNLIRPPLSPPAWLFPIVWTILFILMGIGAYLVYDSQCEGRGSGLMIFFIQLGVNFVWPILFFLIKSYLLSFIWLLLLLAMIFLMILSFYRCNKLSGLLQIPYFLWVTFAGYLNLAIYFLNK